MLSPTQRINIMRKNLEKSAERLCKGEITQEQYNSLEKDVDTRIAEIKKTEM